MFKKIMVGHCEKGTSDKMYFVGIWHDVPTGEYHVVTRWGKARMDRIQGEKVIARCQSESAAHGHLRKKFSEKKARGYVDIEERSYSGRLCLAMLRDTPWVATPSSASKGAVLTPSWEPPPSSGEAVSADDPSPDRPAPARTPSKKTFVVVCVDNCGMEDRFDEGCEYAAREHADSEMVWVADGSGHEDELFSERFEKVS
jgi:predicted DNA-binding WGR domain protein